MMTETKLDHGFDSEQINNMTFELKGRPSLDKSKCKVNVLGSFMIPTRYDSDLVKIVAFHNAYLEKKQKIKEQLDPEAAPWKISKLEQIKKK